jgi:hypothetical protein
MTYHHGLALVLIAVGASPLAASDSPPRPANPRDARIRFAIELPVVKVIIKEGRTLVYEVPGADRPQARALQRPAENQKDPPALATPRGGTAHQESKPDHAPAFNRAEVEKFIKLLQAGKSPTPLKPEPVDESWPIPWPNPAWGVERGPDSVTVWAGVFNYEVLVGFRLPGPGRNTPSPRQGK